MNIEAEKLELMRLLIDTQDEELINDLKSVFQQREHDFWDELPESVKESIEISLKQIENGELIDHETVIKNVREKYGLDRKLDA